HVQATLLEKVEESPDHLCRRLPYLLGVFCRWLARHRSLHRDRLTRPARRPPLRRPPPLRSLAPSPLLLRCCSLFPVHPFSTCPVPPLALLWFSTSSAHLCLRCSV